MTSIKHDPTGEPAGLRASDAATRVDEHRLGRLIDDLATFGARADGGVDRQALTPEDFRSRRFLIDLARSHGATVSRDSIGNLFFRREGADPDALAVVTGSHADSQPTGGRLDGAYGVCAGLEVLAALKDSGVVHRRPIEAVVWTNEEGCRFPPGCMGASAFTQTELLDSFLKTPDARGVTVEEELTAVEPDFADVPLRELGVPFEAFVEAHIEQGPIMEAANIPVGVVRSIQGTRWFEVSVDGTASHAGSTPKDMRNDAFRTATEIATGIYGIFQDGDERLRMTIGHVEVEPGSVNVIPERAVLSVDLRHPEEQTLSSVEAAIRSIVSNHPTAAVRRVMEMKPTPFDEEIQRTISDSAAELGIEAMGIDSGAFHDSLHLARHCPTGMIFVPSRGGLSHNPREATDLADLVAGTKVLVATLVNLANS